MASRLLELVQTISGGVSSVKENLHSQGLPEPSFDISAPKKVPTTGDAEVARKQAIIAAQELIDLLKGPAELARGDWTENASLRIIHRFDLAKLVPVGSDVTFGEIASKARLPERDVRRVLRHAMTYHIFTEPRKGFVAHTAFSRLLVEDEHMRNISSTVSDVMRPSLQHAADALSTWPGSEEPEHTGFSICHNPGVSMYNTFSQREEMGRRFGTFMSDNGDKRSFVGGVEWKGKLVDIGGNHGYAMIDLLRKHPAITSAVVQDLADVVEAGRGIAPKDVAERLTFEAHDFFQPQKETADIFFFRWILHNWSDKYAVKIIQNLIPAMKPDTKIVVNDYMLPEPNTLSWDQEREIRSADLTMLGLLNATERDSDEWVELFKKADSRFVVEKIQVTSPGHMGLLTIGWRP